jgi:hypothetical protein
MANPTTNYGFVLPTSSDLVTDLPADFDVALQGVDTRLKALQPGTTLGDLAYSSATANTNTRLGVGSTGQVLTVTGGVPTWATPSAGGSMTLLSTTSLTGASTTVSSIDQTYTDLKVIVYGWNGDTNNVRNFLRLNGISTTTYRCVLSSSIQTANYNFSPTSAVLTNNLSNAVGTSTYVFSIPNYTNTSITKVVSYWGVNYDINTPSLESFNGVASTEITSAISSLVFSRGTGNLTAGTVLVYGVK